VSIDAEIDRLSLIESKNVLCRANLAFLRAGRYIGFS
jgi:hypothetical protein